MKFLVLFLMLLFPLDARAAEYIEAQLISAYTGTGNLAKIDMALDLDLKDEWYTYWRMPGDSGLAPRFDWTGSENVKDVSVSWPTPKRFTMEGMHSFGYSDAVLFPVEVTPEQTGKDIVLRLKLNVMVCHDICIPQEVTMMRIFAATPADKSEHFARIKQANKSLPSQEDSSQLSFNTAILGRDAVVVRAKSVAGFGDAKTDMIIETDHAVLTGVPEILPQGDVATDVILKIKAPEGVDLTKELFGKKVKILVINGTDALEKEMNF